MSALTVPGLLALLSLGLTLWQWVAARRFRFHPDAPALPSAPPITLLKPLKGCDVQTRSCLRSWLTQEYPGAIQVLFGVESEDDPAAAAVRALLAEFPAADAQLVVCGRALGPNAKVSTLTQLEPLAKHEFLLVSDADVRAAPDFLASAMRLFQDPEIGLVNPFYRLSNPSTPAMRWEAIAINADFWSSVLQARSLAPLRFALGAVMIVRRALMADIGGFAALVNYLADDYELGRRIARRGAKVALCTAVVDCCEAPQGWGAVWRHQLRWARTIRVCQPLPYALSILSNATVWPLLWLLTQPGALAWAAAGLCLAARLLTAADNQQRLTGSQSHWPWLWLAPVKDLLQLWLWALSFAGNRVEWRGRRFRVRPGGEMAAEAAA